MESFYGGRKGSSFVISKTFSSKEEMDNEFSKGSSYTEVNYEEYALVVGNCSETGNVYLRTLEGSKFVFSMPGSMDGIVVSDKHAFKYDDGLGDYVLQYTLLIHFKNNEITSNISYVGTDVNLIKIKDNWLECGMIQTPSSLFHIYTTVTSLPSSLIEGADETDCIILINNDNSRSIYYWDKTIQQYKLFVDNISIESIVPTDFVQIGNEIPVKESVQMLQGGLYFKTEICTYAE